MIALWAGLAVTFLFFFAGLGRFGVVSGQSAFAWLISTWTKETNYEHGWLVVVVTGWLVWRAVPGFRRAEVGSNSFVGIGMVIFGLIMFLAGWRTIQPRVVVASAPVLILGGLIYTQGWARARHMVFPLSMFAFVIPLPGFQQMTTGLQLIATKMAHHASALFGITTVLAGNKVYDPSGNWGSWEIDEGCSGIRSLVALMLVTYIYGMIVHKKWSERLFIFAACVPIAIIANAVRVTSILVVAKFDIEFAKSTWHDYSGFLSFGAALGLLMLMSTLMRHGIRALKPKVTVTRISSTPGSSAGVSSPPRDKSSDMNDGASLQPADPY
ncbi:MAG: exosortase/archaeosortase family protein [Verrucomicrobiota bacterium]